MADRHAGHRVRGGQGGHQDAGDGRSGGLLQDGPHGPLHAVGREQVLGREDPGQDGGVGREEESRPDAQHERPERQMPELQPAEQGQPADAGNDSQVGALDCDDQQPLRDPVRRDAPGQHECHEPHAARRCDERELQRAAAKVDHLIDHRDGPHSGAEDGDGQRRDQHPVFPVRERAEGSRGTHVPSLGAAGG